MSGASYTHGPRRLYRDTENGIFLGVCAGLASFFDLKLTVVRVLSVVSLLLFFWPTVAIYLAAGWLLRPMPLSYRGREEERGFWRRGDCDGGRNGHCR